MEYNKVVQEYIAVADFLTVYISEAHPLDEWALLSHKKYSRLQHRTLDERMSSATVLKDEGILGELVVESMENAAVDLYAALPERLVIILDGIVVYKGGLGPMNYRPEDVGKWLKNNVTCTV